MAKNNTQAAATNNTSSKEVKKMTAREKWLANLKKGEELGYKAARKTGYAVGYATETVKDEAEYAVQKVRGAISGTKMAQEFTNGVNNGKADAYMAFVQRTVAREQKAHEKAENKAAKAAAEELFEDFIG